MAWKIAVASCDYTAARTPGWDRLREQAPRVFLSQGDTPYGNEAWNLYGTNSPAFTATTTQADAEAKYLQWLAKPSVAALMALRGAGMDAYWQPDDHEWADDDWDHTDGELGASFTSQALINQHWARCCAAQDVVLAANWDNPAPNAAGNTQRPSGALQEAQDPPATAYRITYFVADYDAAGTLLRRQIGPTAPAATGAHVRIICIDNISYRGPAAATDDSSKVMLGAQQRAWLQSALEQAAGVPHVIISSTKKLLGSSADNSDIWWYYQHERALLLGIIDASGVKPIWVSGDRHHLQIMEWRKAAGDAADIIDICACPIGVRMVSISATTEGLIWQAPGQGFLMLTVGATLRAEMCEANTGSVLWRAEFAAGSNVPIYSGPVAARLG
jgi:hypothetical protein